ncbi:hypothetical protein EIP86_002791 [Pleurotus ostreatoroseus]|nr:hypothetical protein EIP86_002791 [Pleurotus ostreatoroseus]
MPGPAVYVVAAVAVIGTVAAAVAFKEFVYDPHLAPKFEAWGEVMAERRRRARARRQGPIAVPAMSESRPADLARTTSKKDSDDESDDHPSVELEDMATKGSADWKSTNSSPNGTLRQRKPRSGNVLDESNIFLPFDPISPTQLTVKSTAPSSPASGPSILQQPTPPIIHSPLPRAPAALNMPTRLAQPPTDLSKELTLAGPGVPLFRAPSNLSATTSRSESRGSDDGDLARSTSTASSFTPAVIGPRSATSSDYGTPRTGSVRGYDDVLSLPSSASGSRVTSPFFDLRSTNQGQQQSLAPAGDARSDVSSPFTDVHAVSPQLYTSARSPSPVMVSPSMGSQSSLHLQSESDMAILSPSMRSAMFSPTVTASTMDDPFDDISDVSGWESVGRRTPEF